MKCDIELFSDNAWHTAATFKVREYNVNKGYSGGGILAYDLDYAVDNLDDEHHRAVSLRYPVNLNYHDLEAWPPFLLDLLPSGAGRRAILNFLNEPDRGPKSDWPLLLEGAGNPPGNLRIKQAVKLVEQDHDYSGFDRSEIIKRAEGFIEYAHGHGAPVAGSSGVQGDAPKFLLTQDQNNKWHADGALTDEKAMQHWIVKFPRGHLTSDYQILKNECVYYQVAKQMGLRVHAIPIHIDNTLFIQRFDRFVESKKVVRFGQESLTSLVGIADFGNAIEQQKIIAAILKYTSNPHQEMLEYIFRDILNIACGNTDNHARNTAVRKFPNGVVELTPIFDFAPMFLDNQGISRVCRWGKHDHGGRPDWGSIIVDLVETFREYEIQESWLRGQLFDFSKKVERLPDILKQYQADDDLIERLVKKISDTAVSLKELKNRSIHHG